MLLRPSFDGQLEAAHEVICLQPARSTVGEKKRAAMGQFVKVGTRAELDELEGGKLVEVGGQKIAIFNVGGRYYAIENTCPHRGGPLAEGKIEGDEVICPWHGSRFNVTTGAVLEPPARQGVRSFAVRVTGEDVEIGEESPSSFGAVG